MDLPATESEWDGKIYSIADPGVQERLSEILDKPYRYANLGILKLESNSRKHNPSYMLQLIEALDYIAKTLVDYQWEKDKQMKSLDMAEDLLKSISVESIEAFVTEQFALIVKCLKKPRIYYMITFSSLPDKSEIEAFTNHIKFHLKRGFELKNRGDNWELCLMEFEEAYRWIEILKNLLPDPDKVRYKFFVIFISILAMLTGVVLVPDVYDKLQRRDAAYDTAL